MLPLIRQALWWCRPYNNGMNQNLSLSVMCQVLFLIVGLWMIEVVGEGEQLRCIFAVM